MADEGVNVCHKPPDTAPVYLCCPITHNVMKFPVNAPDGHTYERAALTQWLQSKGESPMTKMKMQVSDLVQSVFAQDVISAYNQSMS